MQATWSALWRKAVRLLIVPFLAVPALAQNRTFDIGVRLNVVGGSGEPTNDILGAGVFGHYRVDDRWRIGFALDHSPEFDVERTPSLVGLQQDPSVPDIDAVGTSTELKSWIEWNRPGRWEWFWLAGVGANRVDIDPVQGPLAGGSTFDIATDASTELILVLGIGGRRWFRQSWGIEAAISGDQHFTDWKYRDRVSGATGTTDDYFLRGIRLGFLKRF